MSKTNSGLLSYAKAQLGKPYWYGCFGQTASAELCKSKKAQYPSFYTASDFAAQYGKRVHDCVGLIKGYLWSESATAVPSYNSAQDKSAAGMYAAAATKGAISSFPQTTGLLVFKGTSAARITHVGIYDGAGFVYEAKGHAYGVVKTAFKASDWQFWAQCPYCKDDTSAAAATNSASTSATIEKAQSFDKSIAGSYKVTSSNLNVRAGAGENKAILVTIPNGTRVKNYGYYSTFNGAKWLYVMLSYSGKSYTGFCNGKYLAK